VESASVSPPVLADSPAVSVLIPPSEGDNREEEQGGDSWDFWLRHVALNVRALIGATCPSWGGTRWFGLHVALFVVVTTHFLQKGVFPSVRTWVFVYTTPICGAFNGTWVPKLLGYYSIVLCQGNLCAP
jgi:hypothetical protein